MSTPVDKIGVKILAKIAVNCIFPRKTVRGRLQFSEKSDIMEWNLAARPVPRSDARMCFARLTPHGYTGGTAMAGKIAILDGYSLLYRAYHALSTPMTALPMLIVSSGENVLS